MKINTNEEQIEKIINELKKVKLNTKVKINGDNFICTIDKENVYSFVMINKKKCCWGIFGESIQELIDRTIVYCTKGAIREFIILEDRLS